MHLADRVPARPEEPFRSYARYLREKYGRTVYRVAVDAGFSCPNRGPDRSRPGCSYCDEQGARAPYLGDLADIGRQIHSAASFLRRRYGAESYLLYLQAFSNTFAPPDRLREIYDFCLRQADFRELVVSTRPDCVDGPVADLLASYTRRGIEVWVELGLQTAHDATLERVRRGHTVADFTRAWRLLRESGVRLAAHLIFGLPGEGLAEILESAAFIAALEPDGVKIHNLHIPRSSRMFEEYLAGELTVPAPGRHLDYVVRALEMLPPPTVVMRLTCDTPEDRLAAPRGFWPKGRFYEAVRRRMRDIPTWQGRLLGAGQAERQP